MTPLEIEIILHYYTREGDYRDGDFSAKTIDLFVALDLLRLKEKQDDIPMNFSLYEITRRGNFFVEEGLMKVGIPVSHFVIPAEGEDGGEK